VRSWMSSQICLSHVVLLTVSCGDDVGLHGVVGRIGRDAHRHGSFEPKSGTTIGTVATRSRDDGAFLLLRTVTGRARSVGVGGSVPLVSELARACVGSLPVGWTQSAPPAGVPAGQAPPTATSSWGNSTSAVLMSWPDSGM